VRFNVEANGTSHVIDARRAAGGWLVRIDDRELMVDVSMIADRWSLLIGPPEGGILVGPPKGGPYTSEVAGGPYTSEVAGGPYTSEVAGGPYTSEVGAGFSRPARSYEVSIDRRGRGGRLVHINGRAIPVSFVDPRAAYTRRRDGHAGVAAGSTRIEAPMAGRVVKVLIKPGDLVTPRQTLIVVEAMKMENELRAPRAGRVSDVRAAEGASIDAGAVLVVLE
jgi:biotin carboxyl carrier protein